ncbi:MAG: hypothetical protein KC656_38285, partial [Myxococcales bacterium]|nr:hypothetical protein [Myxococcales bacterium]
FPGQSAPAPLVLTDYDGWIHGFSRPVSGTYLLGRGPNGDDQILRVNELTASTTVVRTLNTVVPNGLSCAD